MAYMHAEVVRYDVMPSRRGLIQDEGYPVTCAECDVKYHLYYDNEAGPSATLCSILADEIVTARHPDHSSNVVLDPAVLDRKQAREPEVVWSVRIPLVSRLERKPGPP